MQMMASTAPLAPIRWPVMLLVDETGGACSPKTDADRLRLGAVVVRRRGAVRVDVVDVAWLEVRLAQRQTHRPRGAFAAFARAR